MPLFDYTCACGATEERLVPLASPASIPCSCGGDRLKQPAAPKFDLQWARPPVDNVEEVWPGMDTDGVNESQYESTRAFMETS